ncbi:MULTISPECIES: PstS family phosphate ABC transporter substrate-binding protein [unclassified Streptomyces]|uniref:PstS family phosphate ABC transporter substrate-binding protein n=1 Tax=unclassified Streptomyces TaxID=2593676 RepID=UPI0007ED9208|nr:MULTISPECIES: PstS family phosphate ABC transporter substrate-binding protein [unclassified Streptomyces]MCP3768270.1 PstS family phosphate ABC transporter substrate-binding protein [Streptomyces sp. MAR25Y5]OBQ46906.1 phosphate ABC transporter substrate-binding protein [Streptomyces sp. H-KF8]
MNIPTSLRRAKTPVVLTAAVLLAVSACGSAEAGPDGSGGEGEEPSGTVRVDGSSTVAPLSTVAAELFRAENAGVEVTVGTSGTGGGFDKFCHGETDISNASRAIEDVEASACKLKGVEYQELQVAGDGLSVVVGKDNDFVECLTVDQLRMIWQPGSTIDNWNQVDAAFPDRELELFGPGTESGTFDYFTEAVNGEKGASRADYKVNEDDDLIVRGVAGSEGGMGYFGHSYYEENKDELKALAIDGGDGCVAPTTQNVQDGSYKPLARPLFIYPKVSSLEKPEVAAFIEYYVENNERIAEKADFVPLGAEQDAELREDLDALKAKRES